MAEISVSNAYHSIAASAGVADTDNLNQLLTSLASADGNKVVPGTPASGLIMPQQHATAGAPAYVKGGLYFDTTLNKLRVGGASGWETVTSA